MSHSTIGLMVHHPRLIGSRLAKVWMDTSHPDGVKMTVVNGRNLKTINALGHRIISKEEYSARPADPYSDLVEADWAFRKFGIYIFYDEDEEGDLS